MRTLAGFIAALLTSASPAQEGGLSRADLVIPQDVWRETIEALQQPGPALGYGPEIMRNYKYDAHLLRTVEVLFADARAVPRYSGKISDELLAAADDPAQLIWLGYVLTDISAGRNLPAPALQKDGEQIDWGVEWLTKGDPPDQAMLGALARLREISGEHGPLAEALPEEWDRLPAAIRQLAARLTVAIAESCPYLLRGYAMDAEQLRVINEIGRRDFDELYNAAIGPWVDERQGQFVTMHHPTLAWLESYDRKYAAFGSVLFAKFAWIGLQECADIASLPAQQALGATDFGSIVIPTAMGDIIIRDGQSGTLEADAPLLVLDLGGDDVYTGRIATNAPGRSPIGVLVDLGGSDRYGSEEESASIGAGIFGLGALFDLAGNDEYRIRRSGLGAAHFGTGLLYDAGGNDTYIAKDRFAQGAGIAGLGLLVDRAGDDSYSCGSYSQGLGGTLGAGVLLDLDGNDRYIARDDGNVSELYLNRSVAMSQGCGWGRRADLGDGHTLAGGIGALVDGGGDDLYSAQAWAQGCAYWWALGILEDRAGNDTYRNGKYSAGSAAHFGIGICVDLTGDDRHNQDNEATSMNQYQAHARDGSIGIFFDGAGDDRYVMREHCGGSGDLGSIGLFWDRAGDDVYVFKPWQEPGLPANGWNYTPPLGTSTWYPPMRTFRDDIETFGVFLDTGGEDRYEGPDPREAGSRPRQDAVWTMFQPWGSRGIGIDREMAP